MWSCKPREIHCRHGHKPRRERGPDGSIGGTDYTRVDGLVPYTCTVCVPHSYAVGVASRYHELITFYACSQEQLHAFLERDMTTYELLNFLGYANGGAA